MGNNIKIIYEILLFVLFMICLVFYLKEKKIYSKKKKRGVFLKKRLEEIQLVMNDLEKNNKESFDIPYSKE